MRAAPWWLLKRVLQTPRTIMRADEQTENYQTSTAAAPQIKPKHHRQAGLPSISSVCLLPRLLKGARDTHANSIEHPQEIHRRTRGAQVGDYFALTHCNANASLLHLLTCVWLSVLGRSVAQRPKSEPHTYVHEQAASSNYKIKCLPRLLKSGHLCSVG